MFRYFPEPEDEPTLVDIELEDEPVTLCIAAACQYRNQPRIVTCTDWKVSTPYGSAENADKMRWIKKPNWVALTAGNKRVSDALVRTSRVAVANQEITELSALGIFTRIAQRQIKVVKNTYVFSSLGVSYKNFRLHWETQFPLAVALETFSEIRKKHLDASLIVAGFVSEGNSHKPLICQIDRFGNVSISEHFECSGEGATVAKPALLRREYHSSVSLMDAAYRLYEAKKLAEVFDSVGKDISVDILYPDGTLEQFSDKGHDRLEIMLKRFGPKEKIVKPKLEKRYFDSLDFNSLH